MSPFGSTQNLSSKTVSPRLQTYYQKMIAAKNSSGEYIIDNYSEKTLILKYIIGLDFKFIGECFNNRIYIRDFLKMLKVYINVPPSESIHLLIGLVVFFERIRFEYNLSNFIYFNHFVSYVIDNFSPLNTLSFKLKQRNRIIMKFDHRKISDENLDILNFHTGINICKKEPIQLDIDLNSLNCNGISFQFYVRFSVYSKSDSLFYIVIQGTPKIHVFNSQCQYIKQLETKGNRTTSDIEIISFAYSERQKRV